MKLLSRFASRAGSTQGSTPSSAASTTSRSSLYSPNAYAELNFTSAESTPTQLHLDLKSRRRTAAHSDSDCCWCTGPLGYILDDEDIVELSCGHSIHFDCLVKYRKSLPTELTLKKVPVSADSLPISCPKCGARTSCELRGIRDLLFKAEMDEEAKKPTDLSDLTAVPDIARLSQLAGIAALAMPTPVDDFATPVDATVDLVTPADQVGERFWQRQQQSQQPQLSATSSSTPSSSTKPLFADNPFVTPDERLYNPKRAKFVLTPEKTLVDASETNEDGLVELACVFNVKTADFEPLPSTLSKQDQLVVELSKNRVTAALLRLLENNLSSADWAKIEPSSLGELVLFDFVDRLTAKNRVFQHVLLILFEKMVLAIDQGVSEVLLYSPIDASARVSSAFSSPTGFIVNFTTLRLAELSCDTDCKLVAQKWVRAFRQFVRREPDCKVCQSVPLVQMTTNAWGVVEDIDEKAVPEEIQRVKKLQAKGLDLPFDCMSRQIPRPEKLPLNLVLVLPLVNSEDSGLSDSEYADKVRQTLKKAVDSLEQHDRMGLVFLGKRPDDENPEGLGHFYGLAPKSWEGWRKIDLRLNETCISRGEYALQGLQWCEGVYYLDTLLKLSLQDRKPDSITEVIFAATEIISPESMVERIVRDKKKRHRACVPVGTAIHQLCQEYGATFCSVILADEFSYNMQSMQAHHTRLAGEAQPNVYTNDVKEYLALDFEEFADFLETEFRRLASVVVQEVATSVTIPDGVRLLAVEQDGQMSPVTHSLNDLVIQLKDLESGYDRSFMFKVGIDVSQLDARVVEEGGKVQGACAESHIQNLPGVKDICVHTPLDVRIAGSKMSMKDDTPLRLTVSSDRSDQSEQSDRSEDDEDDEDDDNDNKHVKFSILSRLSPVVDAYFIKRKMQLLVAEAIRSSILEATDFSEAGKDRIRESLKQLIGRIWEHSKSCNDANTANIGINFRSWAEGLMDDLGDIMDGYAMRNYQLSNHRSYERWVSLI